MSTAASDSTSSLGRRSARSARAWRRASDNGSRTRMGQRQRLKQRMASAASCPPAAPAATLPTGSRRNDSTTRVCGEGGGSQCRSPGRAHGAFLAGADTVSMQSSTTNTVLRDAVTLHHSGNAASTSCPSTRMSQKARPAPVPTMLVHLHAHVHLHAPPSRMHPTHLCI